MIFEKRVEVDIHDVDYNGIARASALMKYIQTAAQGQLTENGMSYNELCGMRRAFLLSRITMEFTEPLCAHELATALTFPCESRGYTFLRCYALKKGERTIGRAVAAWALINTDSRSLVRVDDFELGLTVHNPHDLELARFTIPGELREVGSYFVGYGITDQNMHMNNTAYPDMYSTFLPLNGKRIHTISINYRREAPLGATLSVLRADGDDGIYYFRTLLEDGEINSEAEIFTVDI